MDFERFKKTQSKVVKLIENSFNKNRLVHAYLFEGAKGTLKMEAAYYLASLLLCTSPNKPCLECVECKRVLKQEHPRIYLVEPIGDVIRKDQIDDLIFEFSRKGLEEGVRIYIIKDIEKATLPAANSLLKFIEETKEGIYGVMITENISNVLSTIKSRSQIVSFNKVSREDALKEYAENGIDDETSRVLFTITNDTQEGVMLFNEGKVSKIIELVKLINKEISNEGNPYLAFFENSKKYFDDWNDKKYHQIFLDLLITITNDRIYKLLGQDDNIVFVDEINEDNMNGDYKRIYKQVDTMVSFKGRMKFNVNLETMYMQMFIEVMR